MIETPYCKVKNGKVTDDDRFEPPHGLTRIDGEIRSSQIVEPADGRLPVLRAAAIHGALQFFLVYLWCQIAPLLLQTGWTWRGASPPAAAAPAPPRHRRRAS